MSDQPERTQRHTTPEQLSIKAAAQQYAEFLGKFEAKKTTDDCFTPPEVFAAVHGWVNETYGLQGRRIVRPFHPGGDFVVFDYRPGDVVLDNPPFSILTKIRRFYDARGIDYFLFAPDLTLLGTRAQTMLVVGETIQYANGAQVATSFITSLQPGVRVRTAPTLAKALRDVRPKKQALPKYVYPANVRNAALLGRVAMVDFSVGADECEFIGCMDTQRDAGKSGIFGGGIIMSDAKAAELKAAELKAESDAIEWQLSKKERQIVDGLNRSRPLAASFDDATDTRTLNLFDSTA